MAFFPDKICISIYLHQIIVFMLHGMYQPNNVVYRHITAVLEPQVSTCKINS